MTKRTQCPRILAAVGLAILLASPSQAYYHYIHFLGSRSGPFVPVYEKFDLTALSNSTVTVYVSDQGPQVYGPNDSFGSVLSQVKDAVGVWNSVNSSALRLSFAGLETTGQISNTPGIDVTFVDLPPGLLGLGGPTTSTTLAPGGFFPIRYGQVMLSAITTPGVGPGPSYLEDFFTTAVHELGHAVGLQHSWTAAAMSSPDITRNTSRARPIDADDVAGISVLYGKPGWQLNYGTITGRVTFTGGAPVSMASVVALTATGPAVSSLTNPDGTYAITGLPPSANYLLYVHPLPPNSVTADLLGLRPPVDANGVPFQNSGLHQTLFYPGVEDPSQGAIISVGAGATVVNQNFTVAARASLPIYNAQTYCNLNSATRTYVYNGNVGVSPAFISNSSGAIDAVFVQPPFATGAPASATILGGFGNAVTPSPVLFQLYSGIPQAIALYFTAPIGAGVGPRHLVLNFGTDIYVMPDAVNLVSQGPPLVNSLTLNPDGSVTLQGVGLTSASQIFFDGLQAAIQTPWSDATGTVTVVPPNGAAGQVATITVYGPDGQNSMFLQGQNPTTWAYNVSGTPTIQTVGVVSSAVSGPPVSLPAGSAAAIDITASNINFVNGQVTVGFGSDDITVRQVFVLSSNHIVADAVVAPGAAVTASDLSIISGFQVIDQPGFFQTQVARPNFPNIALPIINGDPTQATIYPGSTATIYGTNLQASPSASVQVTLNGSPIQVLYPLPGQPSSTQLNVAIPPGFPVGPAQLVVNNGAITSFPVEVTISNLPPAIVAVTSPSGASLAGATSNAGDFVNVVVSGLDPSVIGTSNLQVTVSGVPMTVLGVNPLGGGQYQIQVVLTQSFGGAQVPLAIWVNGSSSQPFNITVR
jgi:uncharacterized protein (TIGR03437 family)